MKEQLDIEQFKLRIRNKGLKATTQRLAVHEAMMSLGHASADMVVAKIREQGTSKVTVTSVYNILSQLADCNIYKRRMSQGSKMFFDVNASRHIHLYDVTTGEYKDVFDDEISALVESHYRKKRFKGYRLEDIEIQLLCRPSSKRSQ